MCIVLYIEKKFLLQTKLSDTTENYSKQTRAKNVYKGQKKKKKIIRWKINSDTRNFFEQEVEEEDYYKPEKLGKFFSNCFILRESRSKKNKTLSIEIDHTSR